LITPEELTNQEKLIKNATNSQSPNAIALMRDKEKVSLQLTPAQIYKIIVSKYRKKYKLAPKSINNKFF
jgi:hypothetical protein